MLNPKYKKYLKEIEPCINCNSKELELFAKLDYMEARKCTNCGMVSTNPYLNNEGVSEFYADYFTKRIGEEEKNLFEQRKSQYIYDLDYIQTFISSGSILDIGSSGGHFLSYFDGKNWKRRGVDLTPDSASFANDNFGIEVTIGNIEDLDFKEKFDLVSMRGVLEHFEDPWIILKKLPELLRKNGLFYISATPAGDSFAFDIYREKWRLFTPLEHVHFFSCEILSNMLGSSFKLLHQDHPYQGTPYSDINLDYETMKLAVQQSSTKSVEVESRAFPGSMINAVWKFLG